MPDDELFESNMNAVHEIKARGGKVLAVSDTPVHGADRQITIPSSHSVVSPFVTTLVGQLLAYHVADVLGRDIDKPRNLAKSVTVK
jgi:glucosamine--fructose-6-phosphate aminotransferase (isomerizing)